MTWAYLSIQVKKEKCNILFTFKVLCESLPQLENGYVTMATDGSVTIATFICDVGYSVSNVSMSTATCDSDGLWDFSITCGRFRLLFADPR